MHTARTRSSTHSQPNVPYTPLICTRNYMKLLKTLKSNSSSIVPLSSSFTTSSFLVLPIYNPSLQICTIGKKILSPCTYIWYWCSRKLIIVKIINSLPSRLDSDSSQAPCPSLPPPPFTYYILTETCAPVSANWRKETTPKSSLKRIVICVDCGTVDTVDSVGLASAPHLWW